MVISQTSDSAFFQINEFPDYYINVLGEVLSKKNNKSKLIKPTLDKNGYCLVFLRKNNKTHVKKLHRLVLEQFKSNLDNKPTVNHINGIKTDNRLINLEWATRSENSKHAVVKGLTNNYTRKVRQLDLNGIEIKIWDSIKKASVELNIKEANISNCCRKIKYSKTAGGFKWEYYDTRK